MSNKFSTQSAANQAGRDYYEAQGKTSYGFKIYQYPAGEHRGRTLYWYEVQDRAGNPLSL